MKQLWRITVIALALVGSLQANPISVLITGQFIRMRSPFLDDYREACRKDGVEVCFAGLDDAALTLERLKEFQVVVYHGMPVGRDNDLESQAAAAKLRQNLDAYYHAGGSIIWMPVAFKEWPAQWNELIGNPYDVTALVEELYDPSKLVDVNPEINKPIFRYLWTTNVLPHAVTTEVKGLFLPITGEWSWPGTVPMRFGKSWQVLVRGMDTTRTIRLAAPGSGKPDFSPEKPGTYDAAPELVGLRDSSEGTGRMMVFPIYSAHTFQNFHHPAVYNDALMLNGYGVHPSNGYRLLLNAYRWLAEPAAKAGLGGYLPPPARKVRSSVPAIDWSQAGFSANSWSGMGAWWKAQTQVDVVVDSLVTPGARDFRGVFGVRTEASDGVGSVADYVARAKTLGLSFVVFLEDLQKVDDAGYAKMVADCKANSSEDFLAVPGFLYRDLQGIIHFNFFAKELPLPENLTPDRRVKVPNMYTVNQNPHGYGAEGIAGLGATRLDPWFLLTYSCISPYVYDEGKLIDDGFADYRSLQGRMHAHPPVSLTIVRSPDSLTRTVSDAPITVIHAESLDALKVYMGRRGPFSPIPVYTTSGPVINRWGELNSYGHPFAPGKQRVRFSLEVSSEAGLADVQIQDAATGELFRHFKPGGAKTFTCTIDDTHKDQWALLPVVTDINGRTAIGPTAETFQDGNRLSPYRDNVDAGHLVIGWNASHDRLVQFSGWCGAWHKAVPLHAGTYPANPHPEGLSIYGFDGGKVFGTAIDIHPSITTDAGTEPKFATFALSPVRLASFDYAVTNYLGDSQFLTDPRLFEDGSKPEGWFPTPPPQVPNTIAAIHARTWAVRARHEASVSANVHEIIYTIKQDGVLQRADLAGMRMWRSRTPLFMVKDREGELTWLLEPGQRFSRRGVIDAGGYVYPANESGGAVGIVNLGPEPISYRSGGTQTQLFLAGDGRQVKAGETITVRFLTFNHPWEGQNSNLWLHDFISGFAIGGGAPGYHYTISQGELQTLNYAMDLKAVDGGAVVAVDKYDLPMNLLVKVHAIPANAIAGRYDLDRKQLLILPVFEQTAITSINTTLGDTRLYTGELFHCNDADVRLSAVQDGNGDLLLELHNPTATARTVTLTAAPGFSPLSSLQQTVELPPYSSVKNTLKATPNTILQTPYAGD